MASRRCIDDRNRVIVVPSPLEHRDRLKKWSRGRARLAACEGVFATPTGGRCIVCPRCSAAARLTAASAPEAAHVLDDVGVLGRAEG